MQIWIDVNFILEIKNWIDFEKFMLVPTYITRLLIFIKYRNYILILIRLLIN